jgi:tetratricopeptide (TPR) repeat protein
MAELLETIKDIEDQIEGALWTLEVHGEIEKALEAYQEAESKLTALALTSVDPAYPYQQRVLAYCLMRESNLLRQMDKSAEAFALSERELAAARLSGDEITLARSLMSNGANHIVSGEVDKGLTLLEEARELFESGETDDHRQGLGWYWILQADLVNAKIVVKPPSEVVEIADRALEILKPIENWPGVARAYAARAKAHESLGNEAAAAQDRQEQKDYESKVESGENHE